VPKCLECTTKMSTIQIQLPLPFLTFYPPDDVTGAVKVRLGSKRDHLVMLDENFCRPAAVTGY